VSGDTVADDPPAGGDDGDEEGIEDWLGMALHAVGIVLVVLGTVLMAVNARPTAGSSGFAST
jgi:hypothetical protein